MNQDLKALILRRDWYTCRFCGREGAKGDDWLTIDHVIPVSRGGHPRKKANLVSACLTCNQKKANMTPEEAGTPILTEGFSYTPLGRLDDGLTEMSVLVTVNNYSRRKSKRKIRKHRKEIIRRLKREGKL
jgi:hypothetical protein